MTARRTLLAAVGGGAACAGLAALPAPPRRIPGATPPDAALIAACARFLELEAAMGAPGRAEDCEDMPEYGAFLEAQDLVLTGEPRSEAGVVALARVALLCDAARMQDVWEGDVPSVLSHRLLLRLAGPAVAREATNLRATALAQQEEARAAMVAERTALPTPLPAAEPSPAERLAWARRWHAAAEAELRAAEAGLAEMAAS